MGFANTRIESFGPASDDTGWLNAGAEIIVHGNAANGTCNAMAQGRVSVAGNIGSRGMTMTKRNPRFAPPELWVLGSAGDYFAEFMAGGVAVVCGVDAQDPENVLGHRPCVGMVGGKVYFRGPIKGYAQADAKLAPIDDESWDWLSAGLTRFLTDIDRADLAGTLAVREDWQCIEARTPFEKTGRKRRSMAEFHAQVWDAELGRGGMIGDLTDLDRSPIPLIPTGELRRFVPVWENRKYTAPCQASCPTGMPVQERWRLVRDGLIDEAVDLALAYTPFPATVCGYLCPNLCMQGCTRNAIGSMKPVDITILGKAGVDGPAPKLPEITGKRVAVIGGGAGGISVAWQLRMRGHDAVVYDMEKALGGKMALAIPESRIPREVVEKELERVREVLPHVHLQQKLTRAEFEQLKADYDYVVLATGAGKPRKIPVPGSEMALTALEFLRDAKAGTARPGKSVVIIGAGNVGCDVATEAARMGAESLTLIDIQTPAAFGKEKADAEKVGATFRWPCFTKEISSAGVTLTTGETIPADTVIFAIGDAPDLEFLPENVATARGHVVVNEVQQTTDQQVFAIGDVVRPGLLTDAIGAGRKAAEAIDDIAKGKRPQPPSYTMIDYSRVSLEYFDPRISEFTDLKTCAAECSSCGSCRDCGLCEVVCPQSAISRRETEEGGFEMVCNPDKCIGCGFCGSACPCGIWTLLPNTPLE
jgi:NADPH-dependent glutamate synthase beta subunit-like oxidoreductase/NAD-dependent dihydropyrimidine dehydrogenase PreA subunit